MSRHIDKALVAELEAMGCVIKPGRKHLRVTYKDKFVTPLATTPSDVRGSLNTLSHARRVIRQLREKGAVK